MSTVRMIPPTTKPANSNVSTTATAFITRHPCIYFLYFLLRNQIFCYFVNCGPVYIGIGRGLLLIIQVFKMGIKNCSYIFEVVSLES